MRIHNIQKVKKREMCIVVIFIVMIIKSVWDVVHLYFISKVENLTPGEDYCAHLNHVFLLGTGRSGSTSISQMLRNAGIFLHGEHAGILKDVLSFERKIVDTYNHPNAQSWFRTGEVDYHDRIKKYADLLYPFICKDNDYTQCGFKEVRYLEIEELSFLRKIFPCAKIILNYRKNVEKQISRQKELWNYSINASRANENFITYHKKDNNSFLIRTEDIDVVHMNRMIEWLGIYHCRFSDVSASNRGGWGYTEDTKGQCNPIRN